MASFSSVRRSVPRYRISPPAIRPGGMGTSPMIERAIMLLPHPDSPMMPTVCRGSTFRFTLSRTLTIPIFVENST